MPYPFIDKSEKTIRIPVKLNNGKAYLAFDEEIELTGLLPGNCSAEIIMKADLLKDPRLEQLFNLHFSTAMLPKNTKVFCNLRASVPKVSIDDVRMFLNPSTFIKEIFYYDNYNFAEVVLRDNLELVYRGTKEAQINSCECYIPLLDCNARSLNHAYTLLSQKYQTGRTAHTGNVFENFYYFNYHAGEIVQLSIVRENNKSEYNKKLASTLKKYLSKEISNPVEYFHSLNGKLIDFFPGWR